MIKVIISRNERGEWHTAALAVNKHLNFPFFPTTRIVPDLPGFSLLIFMLIAKICRGSPFLLAKESSIISQKEDAKNERK
jgi:hypothetical protein